MRRLLLPALAAGLAWLVPAPRALAQGTPGAASAPAGAPPPGALSLTASLRVRGESWDWFGPQEQGEYAFAAALARVGLGQRWPRAAWQVEVAAPALVGLPDDAVQPPPQGQLGLGASYYAANDADDSPVGIFVKQAFVRVGAPPGPATWSLRAGRFEFGEGTEAMPRHATVAAVRQQRVAQRLIGPFGFTHVGRSLDGAHLAIDRRAGNLTLMGALPTRGAFDVEGMSSLDVRVGYGAFTRPFAWRGGTGEWRLFGIGYQDRRGGAVRADNRPLADRQADRADLDLATLGAHYLHVFATPAGEVDLLLWGALQRGDWGALAHEATAGAAEIGWQPPGLPLRPWLRAGVNQGSGDDDAADDTHGTFFQLLPTGRVYARFPFYNMMNTRDVFGSLLLRHPRANLRLDARALSLADAADLWYSGSGAFERETFGYAGRPSGGEDGLATVLDASVEVRPRPWITLTAYGALARGGRVTRAIWGDDDRSARLLYLEAELRR